jgi:hypothetical protein
MKAAYFSFFCPFLQIIAFMEKQRIAEEVASILKLSVDISTAQSEGLFCCLLISFSLVPIE